MGTGQTGLDMAAGIGIAVEAEKVDQTAAGRSLRLVISCRKYVFYLSAIIMVSSTP
jgi:hypothetical protein